MVGESPKTTVSGLAPSAYLKLVSSSYSNLVSLLTFKLISLLDFIIFKKPSLDNEFLTWLKGLQEVKKALSYLRRFQDNKRLYARKENLNFLKLR
jgi:hypothetical protein